jgi:hypothetical protein
MRSRDTMKFMDSLIWRPVGMGLPASCDGSELQLTSETLLVVIHLVQQRNIALLEWFRRLASFLDSFLG